MFFDKKIKCEKCKSSIKEDFSYCPHCGNPMLDVEKENKDFGMLGRNDAIDGNLGRQISEANLGFVDKLMDSAMNSLMRSVEKEMRKSVKEMNSQPRITHMPNGIKISMGIPAMPANMQMPQQKEKKPRHQKISDEQMQKLVSLPKTTAKTKVRRFSDKVVYELEIPGITSPENVFISKLEQGYEIRAIGKNKVYTNSLPIELPIKGFSFNKDVLSVEFENN